VLRVPAHNAATAGGKDVPNMRENRGKAKQYTTVNGRTVVVKDAYVYSNKGLFCHCKGVEMLTEIAQDSRHSIKHNLLGTQYGIRIL
jgi:hypothetical protein